MKLKMCDQLLAKIPYINPYQKHILTIASSLHKLVLEAFRIHYYGTLAKRGARSLVKTLQTPVETQGKEHHLGQ